MRFRAITDVAMPTARVPVLTGCADQLFLVSNSLPVYSPTGHGITALLDCSGERKS